MELNWPKYSSTQVPLTKSQRAERQPRRRFRNTKRSADRRGIVIEITVDEYVEIISQPCHYCGDTTYNGVDRVDNSKGYIRGNCVSCCLPCNKWKGIMTDKDFIEHCTKVAKKQGSQSL